MTAPTITHGTIWHTDGELASTDFAETVNNILAADASISTDGDIYTLTAVADGADNEYAIYEYDVPGSISTTTYSKCSVRYKTSASAANGFAAKVVITYTAGSGGGSTTIISNQFSSTWTVASASLTTGRVIEHLQLIIDDELDAFAGGTGYVYFDWIKIHEGTFTWPFSPSSVEVVPENRWVDIPIWGRVGDISQWGGAPNALVLIRGPTDTSTSWHLGYGFDEELFFKVTHESRGYWEWLTSDGKHGKVTPRRLRAIRDDRTDAVVAYEWELREFHTIGGENKSYQDRFYDE